MKDKRQLSPVNIVFAVSDEYLHLLSVALLSLAENANRNRIYNVFILKKGNVSFCKKHLQFLNPFHNLGIEIIDIEKYDLPIRKNEFYTYGYVSEETYFRFFLPKIIVTCDKVIYCDCDVLFCTDIGKLYDTDLHGHIIGASKNISAIYNYTLNGKLPDNVTSYQFYFQNVLKLKEPTNYFQAGISIYDLKKMRETQFTEKCLKKLSEIKKPIFFDQDILNSIYQDDIQSLPMAWNHVWYFFNFEFLKKGVPLSLYREYEEARKQPKIIHYAGPKPFVERHRPLSGIFWKYALRTPSFDYFLKQAYGPHEEELLLPKNMFEQSKVRPAFGRHQISVMFSSSNTYAPYLGVTISALMKNMDPKRNYDILVLETELTEQCKKEIAAEVIPHENCCLRFINLKKELSVYNDLFYVYPPYSPETYYRLFVDRFCEGYDKIIYIDSDSLILTDLCELYDLDLGDFWVAATKDYVLQTRAKRGVIDRGISIRYYTDNIIALDYKKYIQCGVMVFNLKQLREVNFSQKAVQMLQYLHNPKYVDQDVINKVCEDHILYLSPKYNFLTFYQDSMREQVDESFREEISKAKKDMRIYHMPGGKPDNFPDYEFSSLYFKYARETVFYERLMRNVALYPAHDVVGRMATLRREIETIHFPKINNRFDMQDYALKLTYVSEHRFKFIVRMFRYKLKTYFSCSAKKQKYVKKYEAINQLLKDARNQCKKMQNHIV